MINNHLFTRTICQPCQYWSLLSKVFSLVSNMKKPSRIQVLNIVLFLALFISFTAFYFINETDQFMKGSTTFASRTEQVDKVDIPVLVICFEPGYKPSIYGNSTASGLSWKLNNQLINDDFLKSASYKLNEDIQIELDITDGNMTVKYDSEDEQQAKDNFQIDVYQTYTFTYGPCYVIESAEKVSPSMVMRVDVKDLNSKIVDKLSKLNLFIASRETWYGIITLAWPYFMPEKHSFSFNKPNTVYWIDLSVTSISYQKGHKSVEECIIKWMSTNDICKQCSPIFFSFNDKRPSCQSNEDIKCWYIWSWTQENYLSYKRCMKPMKITLYQAKPLSLDNPFIQNHTVGLEFSYTTDEIKIEEETLMIGTSSYIGSVGGSLGLFLGFSCFTCLSCCIQKVFGMCDKFK